MGVEVHRTEFLKGGEIKRGNEGEGKISQKMGLWSPPYEPGRRPMVENKAQAAPTKEEERRPHLPAP